jgi:ATP synthase protein I
MGESGSTEPRDSNAAREFASIVGVKARRTIKARRWADREVWFGLGASGIIGWAVTIPMIRQVPVRFSWTLTMLGVGIVLGCLDAWFWIGKERRIIDHWSRGHESQVDNQPTKGGGRR